MVMVGDTSEKGVGMYGFKNTRWNDSILPHRFRDKFQLLVLSLSSRRCGYIVAGILLIETASTLLMTEIRTKVILQLF